MGRERGGRASGGRRACVVDDLEQESFAQARGIDEERLDGETGHEFLDDDEAGDDDVGAIGLEARNLMSAVDGCAADAIEDVVNLVRAHGPTRGIVRGEVRGLRHEPACDAGEGGERAS